MKIATLALNPAVDRTMYFGQNIKFGALNRSAKPTVTSVGGNGIDVSLVFRKLGIDSVCAGLWGGGMNGDFVLQSLQKEKIEPAGVRTKCDTRVNIKIISKDNEPTEFNESGGPILPEEKTQMIELIKNDILNGVDCLFMGGSLPVGIEKSFYRDILDMSGVSCRGEQCSPAAKNLRKSGSADAQCASLQKSWGMKSEGIKFILDCDGDALKLCMENKITPYMIKPNLFELEQLTGKKYEMPGDLDKIKNEIKKIYETTGVIVLCTLGEYGGLYSGGEGIYYNNAPRVEVRGFTGAGDTFLTAFCAVYFGLFELSASAIGCRERPPCRSEVETALKFAVAASAAKVTKPGTEFPEVDEIMEMLGRM